MFDFGEETWEVGPNDVEREKSLVHQRVHDSFPQGRENVLGLLDSCRNNGKRIRIRARKTFPFWTWFYEVI